MRKYVRRKRAGNYDGRPGGLARASKLSPERRVEIAKNAASKRWKPKRVRIKVK